MRLSAQILATAMVALQAAKAINNTVQLDAALEDYNYYWKNLAKDLTWPEDNCCRVYRNKEFRSREKDTWPSGEYDWYDFCTTTDEEVLIDLSKDEFAAQSDLDNEIQSYKCGLNTAIRFCKNADE